MTSEKMAVQVGAPDPEQNTSPIVEETDENFETSVQSVSDSPVCYFNNSSFANDDYVCSGSGELLRCNNGLWLRMGTCDPDNL